MQFIALSRKNAWTLSQTSEKSEKSDITDNGDLNPFLKDFRTKINHLKMQLFRMYSHLYFEVDCLFN
jgi:hypothetical protein